MEDKQRRFRITALIVSSIIAASALYYLMIGYDNGSDSTAMIAMALASIGIISNAAALITSKNNPAKAARSGQIAGGIASVIVGVGYLINLYTTPFPVPLLRELAATLPLSLIGAGILSIYKANKTPQYTGK